MQQYQREFIEFALEHDALRFGSFTLKSGRTSPYFVNTGQFRTGATLAGLGHFYAAAVAGWEGVHADVLLGPAYKGIPLVAATAVQLATEFDIDLPWVFNRKEAKDHGEGGLFVGSEVAGRVLIIDDVVTAGTAIREVIELVQGTGAEIAGVVVSVDRQERGTGDVSAIQELSQEYGIEVRAIVTMGDIVDYLEETSRFSEYLPAMRAYRATYGV
ncbi:MAG: orotate phosphoribosyltransferase [Propionibacteriaceae bacterium]